MRHFKAFIHTFWLARVSLASLLLAAIALNFVPQAEDLLLDYRGTGNWWFWLLYNVAFFVWALVIYYFARIAIESPHWARTRLGEDPTAAEFDALERCYALPSKIVPLILGLGSFAIIGYAVWQARANIPATVTIDAGADALVDQLALTAWYAFGEAVLFLIVVFLGRLLILRSRRPPQPFTFFPPFQPELAAEFRGTPRHSADGAPDRPPPEPHPRGSRLQRAISTRRIAWAVGIVAVAVFLTTAFAPSYLGYPPRAILLFILLAGWVPIATGLVIVGYMWRWPVLATVLALLALMPVVFGDNHGIAVQRSAAGAETSPLSEPEQAISFKEIADEDRYASRQQAYVQASRAAATGAADTEMRLDIDAWIARWRSANDCDPEGPCEVRPILVAASGGASRAAFFTGSALGALLDATCPAWTEGPDSAPEHEACTDRPALLDQLFAISSVSGSSLTAVLFSRLVALSDGKTVPCAAPSEDARRSDLWYSTERALSWRRCLELLTVGDYLSPTIAALASRDVFPALFPEDRVKVLQTAFSDHIDWVLGEDTIDFDDDGFLASYASQLACRDDACRDIPWRPLVISNGSSVRTGERIVTSPIAPTRRRDGADAAAGSTDAPPEDVFRATLDFHELADCPTATCDLSLATAVTNSARFPVVSAHGDILDREGTTVDEIVDGGYFESVGVTSLADIARHLTRHGLHPAVIVITNDPGASRAIVDPAKSGITRDQVTAQSCRDGSSWLDGVLQRHLRNNFLETVRLPLEAVLNARGARGVTSLEDLEALIATAAPPPDHEAAAAAGKSAAQTMPTAAIHLGVERPCNVVGERMDNISMSWWLSKPVQAALSEQMFSLANFANALRVCRLFDDAQVAEACRSYFVTRYGRFVAALEAQPGR